MTSCLSTAQVTNEDIEAGTSVHWHGQHLLNASWSDGVAPINQEAVPPGSTFVYRFVAEPAGAADAAWGAWRLVARRRAMLRRR